MKSKYLPEHFENDSSLIPLTPAERAYCEKLAANIPMPRSIVQSKNRKKGDDGYLRLPRIPLQGSVSGVYFLYKDDELVYIGQSCNCFIRVAEHTRKDSDQTFTQWSFLAVAGEKERRQLARTLIAKHMPKFNRG